MTSLLILSALLAVNGGAASPNPAFRDVACPPGFAAPVDRCGYVTVPELHANPNGKTIELFVAVKHANSTTKKPDPVFYLEGGPGAPGSVSAGALGSIFPERDVVGIDQRGVGRSLPALNCENVNALSNDPNLRTNAQVSEAFTKALEACGAKLRAAGVNLGAYRASESALDVDFVRRALGYDKINVYGGSYGTRLAQEVMRRTPNILRAVVLDSVIPASVDRVSSTPEAIDASLNRVFAACAADAACHRKYPNLRATYADVLGQLDKTPLQIRSRGVAEPLNAQAFQGLVLGSLYFVPGLQEVPALIAAARDGDANFIQNSFAAKFGEAIADTLTWGAFYSHECQGEVAFTTPANLAAAYTRTPQWRAALGLVPGISSASIFDVCKSWNLTAPSPNENTPVASTVPTLLLSGEFDPVTPPAWQGVVARTLPNAQSLVLAGQAHGAGLTSLCGATSVRAFLDDPTKNIDASCAAGGTISFK